MSVLMDLSTKHANE